MKTTRYGQAASALIAAVRPRSGQCSVAGGRQPSKQLSSVVAAIGRGTPKIGLPDAARSEAEDRRGIARKKRMPAEAERRRCVARVENRQRERQRIPGEIELLSRLVGKRPLPRVVSCGVVHELERRLPGRPLDDIPDAAPAVAMDRMRFSGKIARQRICLASPTQRRIGDAVGERDQRVRRKRANVTDGERICGGRAQNRLVVPLVGRDRTADIRRERKPRRTGAQLDGRRHIGSS